MSKQNENINKEKETTKRNQTEILEANSTITEMKNSLKRLNRKFEQAWGPWVAQSVT